MVMMAKIAEKMFESDLLITDICKYPNNIDVIDEFCLAIEKVYIGLN